MSNDVKHSALVVDDSELNRDILCDMLEDDYNVIQACDGEEALEIILKAPENLTVVLLDLIMPGLSGMDVLRVMKENNLLDKLPVIIVSGEDSIETEQQCFAYGVFDFLHKPFNPVLVDLRVRNAVSVFKYRNHLQELVDSKTAELVRMNEEIVELLGNTVETRNLESGLHIKRVKDYSRILATELMHSFPQYGLTEQQIDLIVSTSALHDVGKIMIPDAILLKPGRYTPEEFDIMKSHCDKGCEVLERTPSSWSREFYEASFEICRCHHERWDGRGYPRGLKENEIPISAQIVSVADCYDALVCERVYKKAFPLDVAFEMIINGECGIFNPDLMVCFTNVRLQMEAQSRED